MAGISKRTSGSWVSGDYGIMKTATDTITTLPAVIYPNASTVTVGLKGNTIQNGTPTPDSPVMPEGCGERTVNLFDKNNVENILVSTSGAETTNNNYILSTFIPVDNMVTIFATKLLTDPIRIIRYDVNKQFISRTDENNANNIVVDDCAYIRINANKDHWNISTIQAEHGIKTPYEPYGYKIPISLSGTTTPVYLGEVESTRRIKKLVLTGEENWTKNDTSNPSNYLYYQIGYLANKTCVCSHLADMGTLSASKVGIFNGNNVLYLNFGSAIMNAQPSGNTVAGLKEYLAAQYAAGTPVTVWYVLATEETAVVNEPLMRIGDYADSLTTSIPCTAGSNSFDVDTTVAPSEVTATFEGWHAVSAAHECSGGAWD